MKPFNWFRASESDRDAAFPKLRRKAKSAAVTITTTSVVIAPTTKPTTTVSKPLADIQTKLADLKIAQATTRRAIAAMTAAPVTIAPAPQKPAVVSKPEEFLQLFDAHVAEARADFSKADEALAAIRAACPADGRGGLKAFIAAVTYHAGLATSSTASWASMRALNQLAQTRAATCGNPAAPTDPEGAKLIAQYRDLAGQSGIDFYNAHAKEIIAARAGILTDAGLHRGKQGLDRVIAAFQPKK